MDLQCKTPVSCRIPALFQFAVFILQSAGFQPKQSRSRDFFASEKLHWQRKHSCSGSFHVVETEQYGKTTFSKAFLVISTQDQHTSYFRVSVELCIVQDYVHDLAQAHPDATESNFVSKLAREPVATRRLVLSMRLKKVGLSITAPDSRCSRAS